MDQYIEVLHELFALEETVKGAIDHLYQQTMEGHFQETAWLFTDIVIAFQEIKNSLVPVLPKLENNQLAEAMSQLFDSLEILSHLYHGCSQSEALAAVENILLPRHQQWQTALKKNFFKYTLS